MTETLEFTNNEKGIRLDKAVSAQLPDISRSQVQQMIADGMVMVNGEPLKAGVKLNGGESVHIMLPEPENDELAPQSMDLNIVFEDDHLAVIDKPAGLVVHPGVGNADGTLVNGLLARYPHLIETERKGIVHRLDKDTSGLMVIGLTAEAIEDLMMQFQERTVDKAYLALCEQAPATATGVIDAPIGRDPKARKRMAVVRDGKPAVTEFEVLENEFSGGQALVRCKIETGRTHQIRVHMAFVNAPIVGDPVYGYRKQRVKLKRQFLHAAELAFDHPETGERMGFTSPLPYPLQNLLDKLR
ncbi:MAG: RluA family pseudouridine synthase [Chloroflexota bacterium]